MAVTSGLLVLCCFHRYLAADVRNCVKSCSQWLTALVETGQKHVAAKGGAGTWKHVQPPSNLYLEADYECRHIAELHRKLDDTMVSLAESYKQRDGAKRHKQVMIQMATPKHRPKRRQKQLRKAADARIEAATREGDATISKMQENVLKWKGTPVSMVSAPG